MEAMNENPACKSTHGTTVTHTSIL